MIYFLGFLGYSQTITGIVLDAKTQKPIETAVVYFDNTTKGTITNAEGHFSIDYSEAIQSPLVISFLGYEKQLITDYRTQNSYTIYLEESHEQLDEVLINTNDGLAREEKLKVFRKEFLGTSKFGRSCEILNEDALIIRYLKKERKLVAHASAPLQIENRALQYKITYELNTFWAEFTNVNPKRNGFEVKSIGFRGNPFYQNISNFDGKKARKSRKKAFEGSILHFMRALYAGRLKKENFRLYQKSIELNPDTIFNSKFFNDTAIKKMSPEKEKPVTVVFKYKQASSIQILAPYFLLDIYGNYSEVENIIFSGHMGSRRFGDLLPLDYGFEFLNLKKKK
ncbi:carboxypeptidase-like regulatory domain-containing protein [Seonamhaeicola sp. ML3]|uniref:carboxypeptidase-like regulatory domain-containing protein n=1 Tax=Seonamhaeicola sp. ML3 TaxID=2937786 RepID=UPI00200C2AB5|nr:carboxypeptidase-like regulatory domain-containing protein [Seonamhaeicola sp. ML3]